MGFFRSKKTILLILAFFGIQSTPTFAKKKSLFFLEYKYRNSTGNHISPAAVYHLHTELINFDVGVKARFNSSGGLNTLTYLVSYRWLPLKYFGLTTGIYHKDYFHINVGEDVVWLGPAFRIYFNEEDHVGIEGGVNFRAFRLGGKYTIPFSFTGAGREVNYFTVLEFKFGYEKFDYIFSMTNKDLFTMFRFQSLGIDNKFIIRGETTDIFLGAEIRFAGMFIGSPTMNHVRTYLGLNF